MENNQPTEQLTKKERKELRYEQRAEEKQKLTWQRAVKRVLKITLVIIVVGGSIGSFIWYLTTRPSIPEAEIISRNGLHWHSELTIFIKGQKQEIPANIGIGVVHQPVHTHDASGVIHLEVEGLVRQADIKLGHFFKIWDKDFTAFGQLTDMTVNGEKNNELENYQMKDGDKIELRYE